MFFCEIMSDKQMQKFHTEGSSLLRYDMGSVSYWLEQIFSQSDAVSRPW